MESNIYQIAERFLPWNLQNSVLNSTLFPYWSKEALYYFQQTPTGRVFLKVNYITGKKEVLFGNEHLTRALSLQFKKEINVTQLPLDRFNIQENPTRLEFSYQKKKWQYDLEKDMCTEEPENDSSHLVSPNKENILKIKGHNLLVNHVNSKEETQLTYDGEPYWDYATSPETNTRAITQRLENTTQPPVAIWSPDSFKIVTHKLDQRKVNPLHLLQNAPLEGKRPLLHTYRMSFSGDTHLPIAELIIIDIRTKKIIPLKTDPILSPYLTPIEFKWVWWSDDSKKIYFIKENRASKELTFCVSDAETGITQTLITEPANGTYVEPSQLFLWPPQIIVLEHRKQIIWLSERSGYFHLYLYEIGKNTPTNAITQGEWCAREVYYYDSENDWLYFSACGYHKDRDPYYKFLFRCHLDGSGLECLTEENAHHTIHFSPQKNCFLDTYSTISTAPISLLKSLDGKLITHLETADLKALNKLNWIPPQRFQVKARDNVTDIYGNLYFPSHFDSNKTYPLIDHIYPGPQVYRTTPYFCLYNLIFRSAWTAQALAELGFIVLHIDGFGTPGRSKAFHHATYQNISDCGLPDHVTAIQQLAKKYSFIDLERIGVTGFSAGGYAAARAMLLYPDFFKVGVAAAGNHDLRCYPASYGEKYNSLDTRTYESQSNAALARNLKGKLLLIHGEMDDNVHPCATMQLVNALINYNKDFDMLIMPNQNHRSTFDHPYYARRHWDYFLTHLAGKTPSKDENYQISSIPSNFPQLLEW